MLGDDKCHAGQVNRGRRQSLITEDVATYTDRVVTVGCLGKMVLGLRDLGLWNQLAYGSETAVFWLSAVWLEPGRSIVND